MMLVLLLAASGQTEETPCQKCCAPGGDCSRAYKGTPGKCCGTLNGQAFCCPGITYRGSASGDAKCYNCGGQAYRCYTGSTSRNICGGATIQRHPPHDWARSTRRYEPRYSEADSSSTGMLLLLGVAVVIAALFCVRRQHDILDQVALATPCPSAAAVLPIPHPTALCAPRSAHPAPPSPCAVTSLRRNWNASLR